MSADSKRGVENDPMRAYARQYEVVTDRFERAAADFGLPFEPCEAFPREARESFFVDSDSSGGVALENCGFSVRRGWISPSCVACRRGLRSATFFISLKCHRSCYFCFNPNQEDYEFFRHNQRDIETELRGAHARGIELDHIAVTGGEPLLHFAELISFVSVARELYPLSRIRLYTTGEMLDDGRLAALANAGLNEMRFSVKPEEPEEGRAQVVAMIRRAVSLIPDVMVEMPVGPFDFEDMCKLLVQLDEVGVKGINLLELCYPFNNASEFAKRGFTLRKNPYHALYDYWYGGGLPIAGSERTCLELVRFSEERRLGLGVHYCSADNKNTGQLFQQNFPHREEFPFCSFSEEGHYLVSIKVFGSSAPIVHDALKKRGVGSVRSDNDYPYIEFSPEVISLLPTDLLEIEALRCLHVVELRGGEAYLRELRVDMTCLHSLMPRKRD